MDFEYVGDLTIRVPGGERIVGVFSCSECSALVVWAGADAHEWWHRDSA